MSKKTVLSMVAGVSGLVLAATCLPVLAFGPHGGHHHHGGGDEFGLYAKAAGITHEQIRTAFQGSNIKTDFQNLRAAKKALDACIIAGTCSNEVATYATDLQTLTTDKLNVWQTLFQNAPNKSAAISLKTQLDGLNATRRQLLQGVFGSSKNAPATEPGPQG
jgi:hypothetical protein